MGQLTNGGLIWGAGNTLDDPLIETVSSFTITSISSPAVDSGTNIPEVTTNYIGYAPDMGWKESNFDTSISPNISIIKSVSISNSSSYINLGGNIDDLVPGARITYIITYTNRGNDTAYHLVISDNILSYQTYYSNSMMLNGSNLSDAADSDAGDYNGTLPGGITVVVTNVALHTKGVLKYKVHID